MNKIKYIQPFFAPLLIILLLSTPGNLCYAAPESNYDAVRKYNVTEKYSVPYSTVYVADKSLDKNVTSNGNNFIAIFFISIVLVLMINGIIAIGIMRYFKKKSITKPNTKNAVEVLPSQPIEIANTIDTEYVDDGIQFAEKMGRGYGEISVIQKIRSAKTKKNFYKDIIVSMGGKSKRDLVSAAKKFEIGSGELSIALKLYEYENNKSAKERV